MELHESQEMYLETILRLSEKKEFVHAIDVANELGFSRPSVSIAIKALKENGYIEVLNNQALLLTEKGKNVANGVFEKHKVLTELLVRFGVNQTTAEEDACKIEHIISEETFNKIKEFLNK